MDRGPPAGGCPGGPYAGCYLECEPWGHFDHEDIDCDCQSSDRTAAYVHDLTVNERGPLII